MVMMMMKKHTFSRYGNISHVIFNARRSTNLSVQSSAPLSQPVKISLLLAWVEYIQNSLHRAMSGYQLNFERTVLGISFCNRSEISIALSP